MLWFYFSLLVAILVGSIMTAKIAFQRDIFFYEFLTFAGTVTICTFGYLHGQY